jgi:hypothetical protein
VWLQDDYVAFAVTLDKFLDHALLTPFPARPSLNPSVFFNSSPDVFVFRGHFHKKNQSNYHSIWAEWFTTPNDNKTTISLAR